MVIDMYEHTAYNEKGEVIYRQITPYAEMCTNLDMLFDQVDHGVMGEITTGVVVEYMVGDYKHQFTKRDDYVLHKNMYSMKVTDRSAPSEANGVVWFIGNFKEVFTNLKPVFVYYNQLGSFNKAMTQLRELKPALWVQMQTVDREIRIEKYKPIARSLH